MKKKFILSIDKTSEFIEVLFLRYVNGDYSEVDINLIDISKIIISNDSVKMQYVNGFYDDYDCAYFCNSNFTRLP